jgi:hypothetical protein
MEEDHMKVFEILASKVYNVRVIAEDRQSAEVEARRKILQHGEDVRMVQIDDIIEIPIKEADSE